MTEKLRRRGLQIYQDYEADILHLVNVGETMDRDVPLVKATMTIRELSERIARREPAVTKHQGMVIVDAEGKLFGIITRRDISQALDRDPSGKMTVLDAGTRNVIVAYSDDSLFEAAARMANNAIGRLPVVDCRDPKRIVGYLGRPGLMAARLRELDEEQVRE